MFHLLEKSILAAFSRLVAEKFAGDVPVLSEQPKQSSFGELSLPVAFQLARPLKKAPKAIAQEIVDAAGSIEGVAGFEIAGNGFINVRFDRGAYGLGVLEGRESAATEAAGKIIVEHTNINPNKAAHIGHLRNAILGDTFVRMLRAGGRRVEVQNYIDNTGVQVADVAVAFEKLENKTVADVQKLIDDPSKPFDYLCWDLYAKISSFYSENKEAQQWRRDALHAIEHGEGLTAELAQVVADAIVKRHLATMYRLGIVYDVLPRESEILHLQFWATAFEQLKERKAIYLETDGKNKGCWVMPASAFRDHVSEEEEEADDSKVIVRSNGTVTYVGKDIAYQLWKFGLLGKDFFYRLWSTYPDDHQVWVSTDKASGDAPKFGAGAQVFNVIDSRQSYLQDVVVAGLRALGYADQANKSIHFSYEMVALTPATCVEMGIELSEEDKRKQYVEVSGRKGLGVKADDLIDSLIEKALVEVTSRHAESSEQERRTVATQIAVGALRYFMLKFTRNSVIAFDMQEALSFVGETGPYVQYAALRAGKILRKLADRGETTPDFAAVLTREALGHQLADENLWQFLLTGSKAGAALERAIASGEPSHVARYGFQLAQSYSSFYEAYEVLSEENPEKRAFLLWMTEFFRAQLERTLKILGIEVPVYM